VFSWELYVLGDARKQNIRDLNGFGDASKEDYIQGGENRSGPLGTIFFFSFFSSPPPKKKRGDRKPAHRQRVVEEWGKLALFTSWIYIFFYFYFGTTLRLHQEGAAAAAARAKENEIIKL
jgi:hypothetical protein